MVVCFIDPALKYRRSATVHSSPCSSRIAPTKRTTAAGFGKIPTTFDLRLISLFNRSSGLTGAVRHGCQEIARPLDAHRDHRRGWD